MDPYHKYIISIPLNITSLNELGNFELPFEEIEWEEFFITEADYNNLFDLFTEFNHAFDIIIDEFEEEVVPADGIETAIALTMKYAEDKSAEVKASTEKLLTALKRARELGKEIDLFF